MSIREGIYRDILRYRSLVAAEVFLLKLAVNNPICVRKSEIARINSNLAARKFQLACALYFESQQKAGYREGQPRWSAGNGIFSGRWSGGSGAGLSAEGSPSPPIRGHHFVPKEVFNDPEMGLSEVARNVFNESVTGRLQYGHHRWSESHRRYNKAIKETLDSFLRERGVNPSSMTDNHAKEFIDVVKRSNDPRIRDFNLKIFRREIMYWLRRAPRGNE
ncbi:hypothetical protein ABLE91_18705 [Aquabacter sp. CN5-332]|uniref:hypothetical protein n=1 Tax=Aquabacter sp. CN5-332 TaxID=3156608 RepID=UPI0032B4C23D